jgi:cell division protein FtsN
VFWALLGFGVGLFVAFLAYLRYGQPAPTTAGASLPPATTPAPPAPAAPPASAPATAPGKPRFEFYTLLPEMEVPVPANGSARAEEKSPPPVRASGETYVLQVGSFRTPGDADRLKASLTLMGLDATVQTVSVDGKATWHRVRVGPYTDMARVNEVRRRLKENDLEAVLLKLKG